MAALLFLVGLLFSSTCVTAARAAPADGPDAAAASPAPAAPGARVLTGLRLWDGSGGPVQEDAWIVVADGRFLALGSGALPAGHQGLPVQDLGGATVIPGLIDTHTHPWAVPGATLRADGPEQLEQARKRGFRAFLACGVTTVLDAGASLDAVATMQGWLAAGEPGPDYHFLGPVMGPTDGYVDAFLPGHPGIDDLPQAQAHLDRLVSLGALGAKLAIEAGYFLPVLPMHSQDLRQQIAAAAAERDLPLFIHAQHREAHERALELKPRAVMHMVRESLGELPQRYRDGDTALVSTLNLEEAPLLFADPADLDDPLARLVVPADQRDTATSRKGWRQFKRGMAQVSLPHGRPWFQSLAGRLMPAQDYLRASRRHALHNAAAFHDAGVPLVMGSDSGAYDQIPFYFHGISSLREIAMLVQAGLSPQEALLAATRDAAAMLGLPDRGRIAPGMVADLVVLAADPLQDPAALRTIQWTMHQGEMRTPRGWLEGPTRLAPVR